ncbi:MAG TPA: dsRBD fold-containing protein [Asanoa sp.]
MLRAENLTVEIFIDEDEDGVWYAEALMFTTTDRSLLARGRARLEPGDPDVARMDDGRIAAVALLDLVRTLTDGEPPAGDVRAP